MKKYFSTYTQTVFINGIEYKNALVVNGIQYSSFDEAPFGVFEYKESYGDNIIGKMFEFDIINNSISNERFTTVALPTPEPTQLDRIEAAIDYLMMLSEVQ